MSIPDSLQSKLQMLLEHHEELAALLSDPDVINDQNRFRDVSKEYAQLEETVNVYREYQTLETNLVNAKQLSEEDDADMKMLAEAEIAEIQQALPALERRLKALLLPKDPDDKRSVFLEVRAGTGGDEAAIFVGDLFRMYTRYAESQGWQVEVVSMSESEQGGYKEIISRIIGDDVYSRLKFESGAHRVQRVPVTESQGRIHTSACTVAVMPEVDMVDDITIDPSELRIDTYRASGAGGQHVNRTDSAVRITHIPTGVVVECQEERSQHKNKAKAMAWLQARILDQEKQKQMKEQAQTRKSLVGSGDRSERIRTYNYPQGRITDHRINLTLYKLSDVIEGDLGQVIEPLIQEHQASQLTQLENDK